MREGGTGGRGKERQGKRKGETEGRGEKGRGYEEKKEGEGTSEDMVSGDMT